MWQDLQTKRMWVTQLVKYHNGIIEEKNKITHYMWCDLPTEQL